MRFICEGDLPHAHEGEDQGQDECHAADRYVDDVDAGLTLDQEMEHEAQDYDAGPVVPRRVVGLTMVAADTALQRIAGDEEQELSPAIKKIGEMLASRDFSNSGDGDQVGVGGAVAGSSSVASSARDQVAGVALGSPESVRNAIRFTSGSSALPLQSNIPTSPTSNVSPIPSSSIPATPGLSVTSLARLRG